MDMNVMQGYISTAQTCQWIGYPIRSGLTRALIGGYEWYQKKTDLIIIRSDKDPIH